MQITRSVHGNVQQISVKSDQIPFSIGVHIPPDGELEFIWGSPSDPMTRAIYGDSFGSATVDVAQKFALLLSKAIETAQQLERGELDPASIPLNNRSQRRKESPPLPPAPPPSSSTLTSPFFQDEELSSYDAASDPRFSPEAIAKDFVEEIVEYISGEAHTSEEAVQITEQMLSIIAGELRGMDWKEHFSGDIE